MYFNMLTRNDIDIVKVPSITPTISMLAMFHKEVELVGTNEQISMVVFW